MTRSSMTRTVARLLSLATLAASGNLAPAEVVRIVTPPLLENVEGADVAHPAATPTRIQFLIPASDFSALPATHRRLVAWNYRADRSQTHPFDWTFENAQVWMSTTSKTPLTLTNVFDDNHGPNRSLVQDGSITFPLLGTGPSDGPRDIADGPRLDTPFYYDPTQGNLLVEFASIEGIPALSPRLDVQANVGSGNNILVSLVSPTAETGNLFNQPGVLQFEFVPEPATLVLGGTALLGLFAWRRQWRS